ncbi:MAG TPA: Uma2 family endonuclease [Thiolinea sp.]|nr:Uma2 family endonuclease [Thiolinea sp.]
MPLARELPLPISEIEYLEGEKLATERHEYMNGKTYLMAGASKRHNRIARNFITRLEPAAKQQGCEIYFSDMKVRVAKNTAYYYPDVVISCEPDESDDYCLEKPCLIIEITSESTLRKDYMEKSLAYQSISSLQAYLVVAQDKPQIDMLIRSKEGDWQLKQFDNLDGDIWLPCLDTQLEIAAIYSGLYI